MTETRASLHGAADASSSLLSVRGLRKAFGALVVTDDLSFDVARGETLAIIGPNGAGKSTLVAQLAGDVRPDAGTIAFAGRTLGHAPPDARARLGIARSFQVTTVVPSFSAEDNVALAVQARHAGALRFWRSARTDARLREPARAALDRVGMLGRAHVRAADLAHGEARLLEMAMALACEPVLLLLDEPMAGMGHDESQAMIALLLALKTSTTMLLIEHDMDAVAQLADRVLVLVAGRAVASGAYDEVRHDPIVRDAYLGED
jgi:branched-chain amino acid transport system ATP-binding protein